MEIVAVYPKHIYSIKYDNEDLDEFRRLLDEWEDMGALSDFFEVHRDVLANNPTWKDTPEPEAAAMKVAEEADELRDLLDDIADNTNKWEKPDFDDYFKWLDGEFAYVYEYVPMKAYGTKRPSFLRLYAIKLEDNVYVITGGGIKMEKKIQESPGLKDNVIANIKAVREWLIENGVVDGGDLENIKEQ